MAWTLNQAWHETGVSKSTILRAIKSGRMTAAKDELGQYAIDPAEFYRVFPPRSAEPEPEPAARTRPDHHGTAADTGWLEAEVQRLTELLKLGGLERERERNQLEGDIRFLRERVEHADRERETWSEERASLTARLLTYQPPPPAPGTPSGEAGPAPAGRARRGVFGLFRKAS